MTDKNLAGAVVRALVAPDAPALPPLPVRAPVTAFPALPVAQEERRSGLRFRTVYRVAPAYTERDSGLARVRNISDGGMALDLAFRVTVGEELLLELSEDIVLSGRVGWTTHGHCGVKFEHPIDSLTALRSSAAASRGPRGRPPRLQVMRSAIARSARGPRIVEILDVSQRGMKFAHDGSFIPGLRVKVQLNARIEREAVVRWSRDGIAGVMLVETFSSHDLGSVRAL